MSAARAAQTRLPALRRESRRRAAPRAACCSPRAALPQESASARLAAAARQAVLGGVAAVLIAGAGPAAARLEGVNNPQLLPSTPNVPVIDVAGFLSKGQVERLTSVVKSLEADTGIKLRVLSQAYPNTPGLAVRDYWGVDADTAVFVADPGTGNILNFNVGANVDFKVPRTFWTRLAGKYGTKFYWQNNGEEAAIEAAVNAINACLREPVGRGQCNTIL